MSMLGRRIKTKVAHAAMSKGSKGKVTSEHNGRFFGVAAGGGTVYVPAFHAEPDTDDKGGPPDGDADDAPGAPA